MGNSGMSLTFGLGQNLWLARQMIRREISGRYRGSNLGTLWVVVNPVLMLCVYTLVFGAVFHARWPSAPGSDGSLLHFAMVLFAGMIPFNWFAEVANRAPSLVLGNVNFVKKVVFPLPVLSWVSVLSGLVHALVSVAVLIVAQLALGQPLSRTLWALPLVWLPVVFLLLGFSLWISSLAVFFRDIGQVVGLCVTATMFLSPLFYPVSSLPAGLAAWAWLNPFTFIIESTRQVALWGEIPPWTKMLTYLLGTWLFAQSGYLWFRKSAPAFADVL